MALAAHFDGQWAFTCRPETRTILISHFDWFGVQLPKPVQGPHSHLNHLHIKMFQKQPNFQDMLGCSAYQLTKSLDLLIKLWISFSLG